MSYRYEDEKPKIWTEEGVDTFIAARTRCSNLLHEAGAFKMGAVLKVITGDTWFAMACVDRLVEQGLIRELFQSNMPAGQNRVFIDSGLVKR